MLFVFLCNFNALFFSCSDQSILHRHRKGVGSIPAGGPMVDKEFFPTFPAKNFEMCLISTRTKTRYLSEIIQQSEVPQNQIEG